MCIRDSYIGTDTFTYQAYDGEYYSSTATVTINVYEVNDPPVAVPDSYSTNEDTTLNVAVPGVLSNDHDPDSGPSSLTAVLVSNVNHGTLNLNNDGSFTYNPDTDYFGSDSFTYHAFDGQDYSNIVTVSLTINGVNDPPIAVDDTSSTTSGNSVDILSLIHI